MKEKIDRLFQCYENQPGVVVLAGYVNDVIYEESFGMANLEGNVPLQKDSIFNIASISKPITAAAVLKLALEDQISLESEVVEFFPELKFLNGIRIKHLLNHTSGIENYYDTLRRVERSSNGFGNEEFYKLILEYPKLNFKFGEAFEYSNSGYVLLSMIIERVTGISYEEFMLENIFKPLGMDNTYVYSRQRPAKPNTANGYNCEDGTFCCDNISTYTLGDGAVFSTARDLHAFTSTIISKEALGKNLWDMMTRNRVDKDKKYINYGYGWELGEIQGEKVVYHSGLDAGYRSLLSIFPEDNFIVILLSNNSQLDFKKRKTFTRDIANILRGKTKSIVYSKVIEGNNLYLRHPELSDIKYVKAIWEDEKTMKDIGGPIQLTEERALQWHEKKVDPGSPSDRYFLVFNKDNENVGEASFHRYDLETKTADFNIKILHKFRGRGYAQEVMKLILDYYFNEFGGEVMLDAIANSNTAGQRSLLQFGFQQVSESEDAFLVKMTRERYCEIYR